MNYVNTINQILQPKIDKDLGIKVLDLFAGCGGLSLGFEANGFETIGYEMDEHACKTYNDNLIGDCHNVKLDVGFSYPNAQVIIGGPPCQPFSVGGKQKGLKDSRDGFPIFLDAVKSINPEVCMFENVRGMMYKNKWYLMEVIEELKSLGYNIDYRLLNAKNFGVPQNRERVIVMGAKSKCLLPRKNKKLVTAGDAVGDLVDNFDSNSKFLTESMDAYILRYEKASKCVNPRDLYLDRPARTLTCRNLSGSTGDMHRVRLKDGRRRKLTVQEASRLQSFPDWYKFSGSQTNCFNQIGNSVAPLFAFELAQHMKLYFTDHQNHISSASEQLKIEMQ